MIEYTAATFSHINVKNASVFHPTDIHMPDPLQNRPDEYIIQFKTTKTS
jgi:hypothetical protein